MSLRSCYPRTGTTLHEVLVAIGLLAALVSITLPMSVKILRVQQLYRERLVAAEELANQMDRLTRGHSDPQDRIDHVKLSPEAATHLHEAKLDATAEEDGAGLKLQLRLSWTDRIGNRSKPTVLTSWVYPRADTPNPTEETP